MARYGADWRTSPTTQLRWMIAYMERRYRGACNALQHSYEHNWY
jgi:hypothetical protein